ncbi:peptide synthetase, partial [Vibrio parahaemolyticus]
YQGLYEAFENTVRLLPQKAAIKFGNTSISYKELEGKVERYASNIQNLLCSGSCAEQQVIAIALPKSIELYATILAVLKINACYVPIDPEYPEDRIKNILKGSKPQLLIGTLNFETETRSTSIDALEQKTTSVTPATPFKNDENTSQNAVMIYTSGSTGVPKGVQLTHQNVAHFCHWYITETNLSYDSRCLQFTTVSFDASLLDIFPTFTTGGTLIVPSSEQRHDFEQLNNLILEESVTHCFIPPAMLSAMPQYSWPSMEYIITGGDVCDSAAIDHWSGQSNLVNIYGPTECTVLATFKRLEQGCNNKVIGQPINNTQVYLINEKGEPCQTLEQGELYIAGNGVGPGYVRDIKQTDERFAPIESNLNAGKTYRTGDICFWDNNGEINFIGRRDNQLKIRGFRVELGEIENTILRLDLYTGCVVIADDKKQIRAFVKGPKSDVSTDQLRVKLGECLPDYMMPVLIKELQEFPYTVNG